MRRFLDWTTQTTGQQQFPPASQQQNRRNSHQGQTGQMFNQQQQHSTPSNPARDLEIQHLTKLLHEIKYYQASSSPLPSATSSQSQREFIEKVHKTLPLFLKVFNSCYQHQQHHSSSSTSATGSGLVASVGNESSLSIPSITSNYLFEQQQTAIVDSTFISESSLSLQTLSKPSSPLPRNVSATTTSIPQMDRFPDLLPFAFTIARLFVSEVRQRASNKHAEDASLAILEFLNPKPLSTTNPSSTTIKQQQHSTLSSSVSSTEVLVTKTSEQNSKSTNETETLLSETAQGWNLLLSLNTLALSQSSQIIQLLCDASLPSTLIKCLYLFFDLPAPINSRIEKTTSINNDPLPNDQKSQQQQQPKSTPATSNVVPNQQTSINKAISVNCGPLIKAFSQLLVQLCSHQAAIDELIKKDDLRLLIGIASSQCSKHNKIWRKTAFQTLIAISKSIRDNFYYLDQNICIQVYVENMHRINSLNLVTLDEYIDMIKILLEFLYNIDSNNRNQPRLIEPLIEQFRTSRISELLEELIIRIDEIIIQELQIISQNSNNELSLSNNNSPVRNMSTKITSSESQQSSSVSSEPSVIGASLLMIDEHRRFARRLMQSLTLMAKINVSQEAMTNIVNLRPLTTSRFEMFEQFKMPKPSAKNCILNYEVLRIFKMAWIKCQDHYLIEAILDATISLFNEDKYNYFIFESQQLLVYYMTSHNFSSFPYKVKQKLFKFLEFIIIETNYIPCLELGTLGTIITKKGTTKIDLILGLRSLIACLKFNSKFSDIFREIGLLEVIIELLAQSMLKDKQTSTSSNFNSDNLEILYLLLEASQYLLAGPNNLNCIQFNESGAARHVFNCLSNPEFFQLFLAKQGSSSDEGGNNPQSRTDTPPLSASFHIKSNLYHQQHVGQNSKPSIKQLQKVAFTILRQLILSTAGDEHLANLLGLLARNLDDLKKIGLRDEGMNKEQGKQADDSDSNSKELRINFAFLIAQEVNLKICILKSLMIILKESHRCRTLFRKAGGFVYIVSSIATLEKSLPPCVQQQEQQLSQEQQHYQHGTRWRKVNSRRVWRLIKSSLMTIVLAMRYEPLNLKDFSEDVIDRFTEALRNLGCFKADRKTLTVDQQQLIKTSVDSDITKDVNFNSYKSIFLAPPTRDLSTISNDNIEADEACCQLFRFLYDMSLDMGDGTGELELYLEQQRFDMNNSKINQQHHHQSATDIKSISFDQDRVNLDSHYYHHLNKKQYYDNKESGIFQKRSQLHMAPKRPPSLDLECKNTLDSKALLTFPCIILSILDLIPSCPNEDLMIFMNQIIKSLFNHERNLQLLCEAGMISKLLSFEWRISMLDKNHILHETSEFMFEKLARQVITPKELRIFFRLNNPMRCINLDEIEVTESSDETKQKLNELLSLSKNNNSPAPNNMSSLVTNPTADSCVNERKEKILTERVKALVAMMTLDGSDKSINHYSYSIQPPYIEFDMYNEGFSSIFMPSIAPINVKSLPTQTSSFLNSTLDVHANEKNGILGGVGTVERVFPPSSGLTFSSWFCIENFPNRSSDGTHNLRLLTIYRGSAATGKEYSCFRIQISALDRALTISTQEVLLFDNDSNRADTQHDPDCNLRIWTPELLSEGKWHHLAVTMNRSALKQSRICVYIDGFLVHHQRICYISNFVGSTNSGPLGNTSSNNNSSSAAAFVNAFIGSLPQYRSQLKTQWKQGPCHLIEETLTPNFIAVIYGLGPSFIGNFQSSHKLYEMAKNNLPTQAQQNLTYDKTKQSYVTQQQPPISTTTSGHRPLMHHQSASNVSSSANAQTNYRQHKQQQQLTRVSSTNVNSNPTVVTNFQQNLTNSNQNAPSSSYQLAEDKILISIDARAASLMTLPRMRRIYTRFDCRQVSRVLGLTMHEGTIPILLLHNTSVHLNGPSRGVGGITIGNHVRCFVPSPTQQTLVSIGGCYILLGLIAQAQTNESFFISLQALVCALKNNQILQAQMEYINGYQLLSVFFWKKKHLLDENILKLTFSLITDTTTTINQNQLIKLTSNLNNNTNSISGLKAIQQVDALRDLICECFDLWLQTDMINLVLEFIYEIISSNSIAANQSSMNSNIRIKNLKYLRDMDLLPRMLRLLPQYDSQQINSIGLMDSSTDSKNLFNTNNTSNFDQQPSFDTKAVYLIKQTVFELLNRTPRQTDILYFGQFLASLLPIKNKERPSRTISLRNILLKSLLQMMTKNKQTEVNNAMQEELIRILGYDWFMLFISGSHLDSETITIGFLNLMIILSNEELYTTFKSRPAQNNNTNGGWLEEPVFPTIDGKFNIQLLGINVGVFFGLNGKRRSIKQEVLDAPNFYLLRNCLSNLIKLPQIYLMLFQTMVSRFSTLDSSSIDTIEEFDNLSLDILCDCLVGDTHHKRRQTLSNIQFKCHDLVVCLIYMLKDIMCSWEIKQEYQKIEANKSGSQTDTTNGIAIIDKKHCYEYPVDIVKFLMYLYNNNQDFQQYCRKSDELIDALSESLMKPLDFSEKFDNNSFRSKTDMSEISFDTSSNITKNRLMTQHPASREILELSRLIILDTMTSSNQMKACSEFVPNNYDELHAFERFLDSLSNCKEAQGELVDMLLRQVLLMIDSTARHNSIKTIGNSENILQFQLLLTNSILITQIVTDKICSKELYSDNLSRCLTIIDHQLCLAEQTFKFNEILPKNNPPFAFIIQRVLNRIILFALSRPLQHMSDKMLLLDLMKKIYDNRTIIILNHMHSPQSAEFFVCFTYCLIKIIEQNSMIPNTSLQQPDLQNQQPSSLIEKQYGHPSSLIRYSMACENNQGGPSSSALMLVSMAKKVWDAIYQSKKGILSEAFDVSLSLPAFTLETSLDLLQLKPDIQETCERFWSSFIESEQKLPKKRSLNQMNSRHGEPSPSHTAASTAVNILSGRLTKVVNAASFVSRVVGATAGTMASNVNLVSERISQTTGRGSNIARKDSNVNAPIKTSSDSANMLVTSAQSTSCVGSSSNNNKNNQFLSSNEQLSTIDQNDIFRYPSLSKEQVEEALQIHIGIIDNYIECQLTQKNHKLALHKYLCDEWLDIEYEVLLRERALFGPDYGSYLDKWCLDLTEGPRRMRKKMVFNTRQFYENYPYRPEQYNPSNKSLRYRPPMSYDSHLYYLKTLNIDLHLLDMFDNKLQIDQMDKANKTGLENCAVEEYQNGQIKSVIVIDKSTTNEDEKLEKHPTPALSPSINILNDSPSPVKSIKDCNSSMESLQIGNNTDNKVLGSNLSIEATSPRPSDGDLDDGDSTSFVDFSPEIEAETNSARESENSDSLSVLRLLEKNERISHMFRCSRVQGLDTYEGLLLFGREHFYLIDGFTLLKTREIKDIDSLPPDAHDPIIPNSTPNILAHSKKTCSKFAFDSVVEVHKRRYLLQPIALEVFSSDGRNTLIVFPRNIRNKVFSRLMTVSTQLTNNASESLAGQKSNVSVEGGSGLLSNLIGETSVTQRWVRGELSNFQYLMNLNTIAGRSYNDLMQYPIFPWILADYSSDILDLTKPATFRNLSRPVGAQTSERLEQFKRRFSDWDDTETPPYHYGTFYSSAMIVASYMVRMEPFTQHFLRLQGGHFDLADRMFHSIQDSWLSASKHNMADIKELIPEFFYLPEFLNNTNKFDLGIKQNGMKLDDVILPPWAKDDTREFIRLHRCALESDYVSAHLHEWIDLIFGYKQQGQPAIDAVNVFHHLFYEGNVDIYNTDIDPIKKNAVIGFINNFGQVPKQLFKKPHPARKITSTSFPSNASTTSIPLTPILPTLTSASSLSNIKVLTHCPQALKQANSTFKELRGPVGQIVQIDRNIVAVEQNKLLIPPEYCRYIAWGHADRSLRLGLYDSEKPIFVWEGSELMTPNEVLCCTIPNNRTMITAGSESVITVWKIERLKSFSPILQLYGHVEPVTCLASSQSYSLIVSGSRDRTAIIWDLNRFTFVRQLGGPAYCGKHDNEDKKSVCHQGPISAISINDSTGDIATCASSWLYLWSINGELLACIDSLSVSIEQSLCGTSSIASNLGQLHILSVCFSQYNEWDSNEVILTGASDGSVAIWSMRYYQCPNVNHKGTGESPVTNNIEQEKQSILEVIDLEHKVDVPVLSTEGDKSNAAQGMKLEKNEEEDSQNQSKDEDNNRIQDEDSNEATVNTKVGNDLNETFRENEFTTTTTSEPIIITGKRQRTDTLNSDWVKLSTSSNSTTDTIPFLRATPSSLSDNTNVSEILTSLEGPTSSSAVETLSAGFFPQDQQQHQLSVQATKPKMGDDDTYENRTAASNARSSSTSTSTATRPSNLNQEYKEYSSFSNKILATTETAKFSIAAKQTGNVEGTNQMTDKNETSDTLLEPSNDPTFIKFSKSDTSLIDSFVIVGESGSNKQSRPEMGSPANQDDRIRPQSSTGISLVAHHKHKDKNLSISSASMEQRNRSNGAKKLEPKLLPNHCWKRELYLRAALPRRNIKSFPSAITSITISKDHKTVYLGDATGRISSWTTS